MSERSPNERKCRRCGGRLQRGRVQIHGTLVGFLLIGLSYTHLFFTPASDPEGETVVLPWKARQIAYRCLGCGALAVTPFSASRKER